MVRYIVSGWIIFMCQAEKPCHPPGRIALLPTNASLVLALLFGILAQIHPGKQTTILFSYCILPSWQTWLSLPIFFPPPHLRAVAPISALKPLLSGSLPTPGTITSQHSLIIPGYSHLGEAVGPCAKGLHHNTQSLTNTHLWELQKWSDYENRVTSLQKLDKNAKERTLGCLLVKGMITAVHSAIEINSRAQ